MDRTINLRRRIKGKLWGINAFFFFFLVFWCRCFLFFLSCKFAYAEEEVCADFRWSSIKSVGNSLLVLHKAFSTSNDNLNTAGVFPQRCENMTSHWVQCCRCPDGCSVASLLNPPPDILVDGGPVQMLLYVRAHTPNRTRNWQSAPPPNPPPHPPSILIPPHLWSHLGVHLQSRDASCSG